MATRVRSSIYTCAVAHKYMKKKKLTVVIYIYIYIYIINQLCRKMLKNIFMAQLGFELTTSATPPSTALSVTSTDCAIETTPKKIVRIALIQVLANAVHVVNRVLPYASHLFRLQMKACRIQRIQVKVDKY